MGLAFLNKERRYLWINDALAAIYQINAAEHLGKTVWDTLAPELAVVIDARIQQVLLTGKPILNIEETGKFNQPLSEHLYCISSYYPVREKLGEILGVGVAVLDITERQQAEIALTQSEQRFRQLVENIQDVFWIFNPIKKQFLYASPAYEKIWGISAQSLYANYMEWCEFYSSP